MVVCKAIGHLEWLINQLITSPRRGLLDINTSELESYINISELDVRLPRISPHPVDLT